MALSVLVKFFISAPTFGPIIQQCLLHSYCVHTKFDLAPPFPFFSPRVQLRVDGIVVLNTGDSLVALQVDTQLPIQSFDDAGRLSSKVSHSRGANSEGRSTRTFLGADLSILGTVTTYYTQESSDERLPENSNQKRRRASGSSVCEIAAVTSDEEEENFYSPDFSENSDNDQAELGKCGGEEKVRVCEKCKSPLKGSAQCCCSLLVVSGHRPALRTKNEGNANNSENVKNGNSGNAHYVSSHECLSPKSPKSPKSSSGYQDNVRSPHNVCQLGSTGGGDKGPSQAQTSDRDILPHCHSTSNNSLQSPPATVIHSPTFEVCGTKNLPGEVEEPVGCSSSCLSSSQRSFFSSTSSSGDSVSRSQSSESVIVHTNYARTVTFSVRRFALGGEELVDSPQPAEGKVYMNDCRKIRTSKMFYFYFYVAFTPEFMNSDDIFT